jgi:hypothetical protein
VGTEEPAESTRLTTIDGPPEGCAEADIDSRETPLGAPDDDTWVDEPEDLDDSRTGQKAWAVP